MNWYDIINEAEKRGSFTEEEKRSSGYWKSCACGKLDPRIPRLTNGTPLDKILLISGLNFATAVVMNDFALAKRILKRIEGREKVLLEQLS